MLELDMQSSEVKVAMVQVRSLLSYIGEDSDREGLLDILARVVKVMHEHFWGYHVDFYELLQRIFGEIEGYDELVLLQDIEIHSYCEYHMVSFVGKVYVVYIFNGRVVGLSKFARVVDIYSK